MLGEVVGAAGAAVAGAATENPANATEARKPKSILDNLSIN